MGTYYDKTTFSLGKYVRAETHRLGYSSIPHKAIIIAELDNGFFKSYPDVTHRAEFDYFYEIYAKGGYLTMKLAVISEEDIPNIRQEGGL